MRNRRLSQLDQVHIISSQQVGMGKHVAAGEKAEAIKAHRIRHAVTRQHIGVFPIAFRAMGLHMAAALPRHRTQAFQRRIRAGRNEPWRHHRPDAGGRVVGMGPDIVDQRLCPCKAASGEASR